MPKEDLVVCLRIVIVEGKCYSAPKGDLVTLLTKQSSNEVKNI